MEDIGISPEQFEEACGEGTEMAKKQFQHALFEQVPISIASHITSVISRFGQQTTLKSSNE